MTEQWGGGNPFDHVQDWDVERMGEDMRDPQARRAWEMVMRLAGGLPYIWRELARPISEIAYGLLELRPGDRVLLIGEGIGPAGWEDDIRAIVGPDGVVDVVEIIRDGREAVHSGRVGRNGQTGSWRWDYVDGVPDGAYDAVAILQATQHCDDWAEAAREFLRVLVPGRRIVLAEAVMAGDTFFSRVNSDVHLRQWFDKLFEQLDPSIIPYWSRAQVREAFAPYVVSPQSLEWRGIEMFWARSPGAAKGA